LGRETCGYILVSLHAAQKEESDAVVASQVHIRAVGQKQLHHLMMAYPLNPPPPSLNPPPPSLRPRPEVKNKKIR